MRCVLLAGVLAGAAIGVSAAEFDARLKWFTTAAALPAEDFQRQSTGTPTMDHGADLRLLLKEDVGPFRIEIDHSTTWISGDSLGSVGAPQTRLDQSPDSDEQRIMSLTWEIESGNRHRAFHRFDRLAIEYRSGNTAVTMGRQAASWGSGLVFNPLDLFNPFAPTTVDTDYKPGDDLILVERLFSDGSDIQLLGVGRRADGDVDKDASSFAAKWHGFAGNTEIEAVAARHFRDDVYGLMVRVPVGGALVRTDLMATRTDADDEWYVSGLINADYSFGLFGRLTYVFGEYFHNDFGLEEIDPNGIVLTDALLDRLSRGELFNVMRDYVAVGMTHQWHPLVGQSMTLIANLDDRSSLFQTSIGYDPGDHSRLEMGIVAPLGSAGDEFGGIPVLPGITTGGGVRGFFRWVYFL